MEHKAPTRSPLSTVPLGTRRAFLQRTFLGGVAAAPLAAAARARAEDPVAAADFAPYESVFRQIRTHENDHAEFLRNMLDDDARPKPTFRNLEMPDFVTFAEQSRALENTDVGVYTLAVPALFGRRMSAAAMRIAEIEGRHAGVLNYLDGAPMAANVLDPTSDHSFDPPLTVAQARQLMAPFIANLNGGPPLAFSVVRSAANDIAIANFALALEDLASEFYNTNVPKFYGP
ncbi:ferritin-like domain-containing protein [Gemmata sp.]|uniref:ferritin-like domain-containing protein n=1 Tax=Gemmata sp. TaxID=1914242 RepID=UPI003F712670